MGVHCRRRRPRSADRPAPVDDGFRAQGATHRTDLGRTAARRPEGHATFDASRHSRHRAAGFRAPRVRSGRSPAQEQPHGPAPDQPCRRGRRSGSAFRSRCTASAIPVCDGTTPPATHDRACPPTRKGSTVLASRFCGRTNSRGYASRDCIGAGRLPDGGVCARRPVVPPWRSRGRRCGDVRLKACGGLQSPRHDVRAACDSAGETRPPGRLHGCHGRNIPDDDCVSPTDCARMCF